MFISTLLVAILFPTAGSFGKPPKQKLGSALLSKMSFGPQVGGSFSRIVIPVDTDLKEVSFEKKGSMTTGGILWFTAGVTGEFRFYPQFSVGAELLYGRAGLYALGNQSKVKQERIMAPVVATYSTGKQGEGIRLSLGVQPSFVLATTYYKLTGGKEEELSEEEYEDEDDAPTKDKLKSFDLALVGGLAYRFTNGLEIGMRISQGLLDPRNLEAKHDSEDAEKTNCRSISNQLYVGYNLVKFFK